MIYRGRKYSIEHLKSIVIGNILLKSVLAKKQIMPVSLGGVTELLTGSYNKALKCRKSKVILIQIQLGHCI